MLALLTTTHEFPPSSLPNVTGAISRGTGRTEEAGMPVPVSPRHPTKAVATGKQTAPRVPPEAVAHPTGAGMMGGPAATLSPLVRPLVGLL